MKFILKNLFRRKLRTLFSVLGVGVGVSVMVALFTISDDLVGQITQAFETQRGDIVVMQATSEELESDVPTFYEEKLKDIEGVKVASPMIVAILRTDADFDDRPAILYYGIREDNPIVPHMKMLEGQPISDDDPMGVVFGWRAWEVLQEKMGDKAPKVGEPLNFVNVVTSEGFSEVFNQPPNWNEMTDRGKELWTQNHLVNQLGIHRDALKEETPEQYERRTGRKAPPPRPVHTLGSVPYSDEEYVNYLNSFDPKIPYDPEDPVYAYRMQLDLTTRGVCETGIMLQDTAVFFPHNVAQVLKGKHERTETIEKRENRKTVKVDVLRPSSTSAFLIDVEAEGLTEEQKSALVDRIVNTINQDLAEVRAIRSEDILQRHKEIDFFEQFGLVISLIAALAGAIGILNTMTLAVYERTREIGLLLAVGWSRSRVLTTVMAEGLLLSLIGGLLGVAFGYAEVQAAKNWFSMDALSNTLNVTRSLHAVGLAFGIGFLASVYPAIRASMLQPIDALRHE
ncbi:MAG: ABC transporter permease [Planctomycetes bacterium]|nr:ABC transporter permease [Planctomycetota bacterium]